MTAKRVADRPRVLAAARLDAPAAAELRRLVDLEQAHWQPGERWSSADLVRRLDGMDVLLLEEQDPVGRMDDAVVAGANDVKLVVFAGRNPPVDLDGATRCGILVCNAPGMNAAAVADLTVAFIIMCARRIAPAVAGIGGWAEEAGDRPMEWVYRNFTGFELAGRTVGLIGLGAIGTETARRLSGFGVTLIGHDPLVSGEAARRLGVEPVPLDRLLRESDFVSLHAPVNDTTKGLLGVAELRAMKSTAYLVNTARAALVDEAALQTALEEQWIAGAALDVFHEEPVRPDHPLLHHERVIATPHIGGASSDQVRHQSELYTATLKRFLCGEPLPNLVNPEVLDSPHLRWTARPGGG